MRQLIAGNWKMHGLTEQAAGIAGALREAHAQGCELLVCPPATMVRTVAHILVGSPVAVGGQDCHAAGSGAHTGDISAAMLRDAGATWVIAGHSERRGDHSETDEMVQGKVRAAVAAGLVPIVCVGETAAERAAGRQMDVVGGQLAGSLPDGFAGVVAYEPVWAIGTGRVATIEDIGAMHGFIRGELERLLGAAGAGMRILYGGSVKPENAAEILGVAEVGGALVGGASLNAADFLAIARGAG